MSLWYENKILPSSGRLYRVDTSDVVGENYNDNEDGWINFVQNNSLCDIVGRRCDIIRFINQTDYWVL